MKPISLVFWAATTALVSGCAHTAPAELQSARAAYERTSTGVAAQMVPAEVHKAQVALAEAEQAFEDEPRSYHTRDLAYVALRKAQMADALAQVEIEEQRQAAANEALLKTSAEMVSQTKEQLEQTEATLEASEAARLQAEQRARDAMESLRKLAEVKEEARGLVITLSGSVLFKSDESALLPEAQTRLNQVAEALMSEGEKPLIVEGHTDSQGSDSYNLALSQRRADSVRAYLVSRGYDPSMIVAQGIGEARPVASNDDAEGRANNRRVEIIVSPSAQADRAP